MELILNNTDIIYDVISSKVPNADEKIQVVASLNLYNEKNENDNEEQALEMFSSSKMTL